VIEKIKKSKSIVSFFQNIEISENFLVDKLWNSSKALLSVLIQEKLKKNVLIITGGLREEGLFNDLDTLSSLPIYEFPSWEILPGEDILPSSDIIGKRMQILDDLEREKEKCFVLCPLQAALQKVVTKDALLSSHLIWKKSESFPFNKIEENLVQLGYKRAPVVSDKNEFAIRNGIIDIFPPSSTSPYRIDFFGDEITNIRLFDVLSQKTIEKVDEITISIADEKRFLAYESTTIFEYLGEDTIIIFDDLLTLEDQYITLKDMPGSKSKYFISFTDLLSEIKGQTKLFFSEEEIEKLSEIKKGKRIEKILQEMSFSICNETVNSYRFFHPFMQIYDYLNTVVEDELKSSLWEDIGIFAKKKIPLIFLNENVSEERQIQEKLKNIDFTQDLFFERGYLSSGVIVTDLPLAIVPNSEFTHKHKIHREQNRTTYHTPVAEFHTLQEGDLVVHFHSGIGKYKGVEKIKDQEGNENEFFVIEYAKRSKLFVPLSQSHLLSRYIGSSQDFPTLDVLGSNKWLKTKAMAQKKIMGYASDLLHLYAERSMQKGFNFSDDSEETKLFELDFPFVETSDQLQAIADLKEDMENELIMDRLICGDVGYGKTEVAMRAAFKAAFDGKKQVAMLVPTTVLALQHFDTFTERMANYPISIAVISRFNTPKRNKEILSDLKNGKIDIIIGTHRLLSKDILFKDLGLMIIDEEQRFGVRAKEHLKKLKKDVDCITMSATPIPRTLYLSLIKARDMSVINTPPQDRLPIKTIIAENDDALIKNALMREMLREGQSFFIHNRVESIYQRASHIQKLIPKAKIAIVHGQMQADEIDHIFHEFKQGETDILFSTTIVENGIDIPNANTIIIDRSDTFGLADLYQLRGRVGRWNRMAYAYFLVPKDHKLSEIARKRLNALVEAGGYGCGMKIALRDLEIRGAGDILGTQQSGQVSAIGFHLYCKLLKKTIESLKHKKQTSFIETKIEIAIPAKIPSSYIEETSLRMEIYHRLGDANSLNELDEILEEMKDRFGAPPIDVIWLHHISRLRVFASQNQFTLLKFSKFSFIAEKQVEKKLKNKTILFDQVYKTPREWEKYVVEALKSNFTCIEVE